jgi:ribosome-associated protein YbcJ (S4-like RNA binding protein)
MNDRTADEKVTLNYNKPPRKGRMLVDQKCIDLAEHFGRVVPR